MAKKLKNNLEIKDVPKDLLDNLDKQKSESIRLELRALQSSLSIPFFTEREENLLLNLLESKPFKKSCLSAGYNRNDTDKINEFLSRKSVAKIIFYFKEKKENKLKVNRDKLSLMAMECYSERLSSSEGIRAVEVLAKLWGLNKEKLGNRITINNQQNTANLTSDKDQNRYLKSLSTEELKKIASSELSNINMKEDED